MKILVTGAAGQLGTAIVDEFGRDHTVVARGRSQLDIADREQVLGLAQDVRPDVIINCAAYNNVDGAEDDPEGALRINAFGVRCVAEAARSVAALLVHYGTDFVFDGEGSRPYLEHDPPNPRSAYAISKLLGEWFARDARRHYLLRVESLFGGRAARSSVDRIISALEAGQQTRVFTDRTVSPSYVRDVASATRALIEGGADLGVYHCVNSGSVTWYELAREVARLLGVEPKLDPVPVAQVILRAARPKYCVLSNEKLLRAGVKMPPWQDALRRYLRERRTRTG
ncbi:MAG: dTDP-4-dehydrorhamnose reductase [Acidobacteria bacterium]|nr:dTDP-4-dehydrorhamnose reductase [Acidobacteriota bacterium]